jgi:hypothetical protein
MAIRGFTCTICEHPAEVKRVSYSHGDKLFTDVAIRVCVNPECPSMQAACIFDQKQLTKPNTSRY